MFMENRPEFIITWLGFAKLGVRVAMINTSIKEQGLTHCIKVSQAKGVVFGTELEEPIASVADTLGVAVLAAENFGGSGYPATGGMSGQITVQIHDARIVQIDRTEKIRPDPRQT